MRFLLSCTFAMAASALVAETSLTGSYSGSVVCDRTDEGRPGIFSLDLDLRIHQRDEVLYLATQSAEGNAGDGSLYAGKAVVADDRVSGYVTACRPSFDYQEIVRILPTVEIDGQLVFSAETVFVTEDAPGLEGRLILESCRWAMERTSSEIPAMETCQLE